jgi:hypothetical protein
VASKAEIVSAIKAEFANKHLADLENGAMAFMMSKSAYLFDVIWLSGAWIKNLYDHEP